MQIGLNDLYKHNFEFKNSNCRKTQDAICIKFKSRKYCILLEIPKKTANIYIHTYIYIYMYTHTHTHTRNEMELCGMKIVRFRVVVTFEGVEGGMERRVVHPRPWLMALLTLKPEGGHIDMCHIFS